MRVIGSVFIEVCLIKVLSLKLFLRESPIQYISECFYVKYFSIKVLSLKLCLVLKKYNGKKKNVKKNDFFIFDCLMKNIKKKLNVIKINQKFIYF